MTVAQVVIPNKLLFTRAEVCALLGVNRATYADLVRTGVLRTVLPPGFERKRMVPREALAEALRRINQPG